MLSIIEPQDHNFHQQKIDSLLSLFSIYHHFTLPRAIQEEVTYVVAEDEAHGVYGGALFYPQKAKDLHEEILNLFTFSSNSKVWAARLCCCEAYDDPVSEEKVEFYETFFRELYSVLGDLTRQKRSNCLPLVLSPQEYHDTLTYARWPFLSTVKFSDTSQDLHALLSFPSQQWIHIQPEEGEGPSPVNDQPHLMRNVQ